MKQFYRLTLLMALTVVMAMQSSAEAPANYYSSCEGKTGQALLRALYDVISDHINVGYDGLWDVYRESDVRADGSLWDIYTTKQWGYSFTRCGNYSVIGDCVNREHSLPKSWWGGGKATQYSDAFHLYPTDGKVNGQRSNYPYGECANGSRLPDNGSVHALGRLGSSTFSGYSGTVFEPDDQYKGDLARSYFYMAACYNSIIAGWTSGNGADVFAGNTYPVFTSWTQNLLLKWARQDAVSQKEIDRNEAIYKYQENRNPFIDYPEMVEYIWGDKVGQAWYPGGTAEPAIQIPVKNATVNLGLAAVGVGRSAKVAVKGTLLTRSVSLSTTGDFTVSPSTLTAAQVNEGTEVTVTVKSSSAGDAEGTLTISSQEVNHTVDLYAEVVDGLPLSLTDVTSEGFTLRWVNLHTSDASKTYSVRVSQGSQLIQGYPVSVVASAESYTVSGLEPSTLYTVTLGDVADGIDVPVLSVTTADLIPSISLLFDGQLHFDVAPDTDSEAAELLIEAENIADDITVGVQAPFQVSTDKSSWSTTVTLAQEEDRFYLRLAASPMGSYESTITLTAGTYVNDDASVTATVAEAKVFFEDWEVEGVDLTKTVNCYSSTTFDGHACRWAVDNGGFGTGTQDSGFNGSTVLRMGKNTDSSIAMDEDKAGGLGTVSFDASAWPNDAAATVEVEYSTDGGISWTSAGTATLAKGEPSKTFSFTVNTTGNGRVRFRQSSGSRWFIDNIAITDYSAMGAVADLDYHSWDAYCSGGNLVIESRDAKRCLSVYSIDGISRFSDAVDGCVTMALPAGLYIVTDGNFARRVLVK